MKISKRDMILLAAVGLVALIGGFWYFYARPAGKDISSKREEVAAARQEVSTLRDNLQRMRRESTSLAAQTAQSLRMAKAVPDSAQAPAAIVQLQRVAERSNVRIEQISTGTTTDYGGITEAQIQVQVKGEFFDVDDFLYRVHTLVGLDDRMRPVVGGRLLALKGLEISLAEQAGAAAAATGSGVPEGNDEVLAVLDLVAYYRTPSASTATAAGAPTADPAVVSPAVGAASQAAATASGGTTR